MSSGGLERRLSFCMSNLIHLFESTICAIHASASSKKQKGRQSLSPAFSIPKSTQDSHLLLRWHLPFRERNARPFLSERNERSTHLQSLSDSRHSSADLYPYFAAHISMRYACCSAFVMSDPLSISLLRRNSLSRDEESSTAMFPIDLNRRNIQIWVPGKDIFVIH